MCGEMELLQLVSTVTLSVESRASRLGPIVKRKEAWKVCNDILGCTVALSMGPCGLCAEEKPLSVSSLTFSLLY